MKELNEKSFLNVESVIPEQLYNDLLTYGYFVPGEYTDPDTGTVVSSVNWVRKDLSSQDTNFFSDQELKQFNLNVKPEDVSGTVNKPLPASAYNVLASHDEWHGGYVEGFGHISEETSSSMYGNSIIMGGSLYACGPGGMAAVRKAKFYQLKKEGRWRGGNVENWGYVSQGTQILGSSYSMGDSVSAGERTLGAIMLISCALERGASLATLRKEFADCWNQEKGCYEIDSRRLSSYLQAHYPYNDPIYGPDDVQIALANHRVIFLRQITRQEDDWRGERTYGNDSMIVDYNVLKQGYEYLNPVGAMSIGSVPEYNVRYEVDVKVYIYIKY